MEIAILTDLEFSKKKSQSTTSFLAGCIIIKKKKGIKSFWSVEIQAAV